MQPQSEFLDAVGEDQMVAGLICAAREALRPRGFKRLVFFAAGIAPGHDDLDRMARMAKQIQAALPEWDVSVDRRREPHAIVQLIAGSGLVIGHSLHVRVVAASYDTPRISLSRPKTEDNAKAWDPHMPAGAYPQDLFAASIEALDTETITAAAASAARMVRWAATGLDALQSEIEHWSDQRASVRQQRRLTLKRFNGPTARVRDTAISLIRRLAAETRKLAKP